MREFSRSWALSYTRRKAAPSVKRCYADIEIDNDLSQLFLNSINDGQCLNSDDLECPILQEVELAISQLNLKKAPGEDGLPTEFYEM
uniref:Reverse transcriptase domain-containing protein n=1 Tax=Anguilla anguilla TaxID=7936 RepID=A0A0E9UII8_ANGAN